MFWALNYLKAWLQGSDLLEAWLQGSDLSEAWLCALAAGLLPPGNQALYIRLPGGLAVVL